MAGILTVAAETGNIDGLYASIKVDPKVLDDIDAIPFVDTPLHTAASAGHTDFAIEILRLKPSFGRKLNSDGLSSLHLALINDKFETVKRLIKFDKELIRVKGREGANSLHFLAKNDVSADQQRMVEYINADQQQRVDDRVNILAEFLFAYPDSIEDLTIQDETALHIAVKTKNQSAVEVILGCIRRIEAERVMDKKDENGNTPLHIAVFTSQPEMVKLLVKGFMPKIGVNEKNSQGKTALDIALVPQTDEARMIVRSLRGKGALESSSPRYSLAEFLKSRERPLEVIFRNKFFMNRGVSVELRNMGLAVAVLVATTTFQAVLSPPGGVGGGGNNLLTNGTNVNATVLSTNKLFYANTSFMNATLFVPTDDPVNRVVYEEKVYLGTTILTYGKVFSGFYSMNTFAFILSMVMIMVVLPARTFALLHGALLCLILSYGYSFFLISPSYGHSQIYTSASVTFFAMVYGNAFLPLFTAVMDKVRTRIPIDRERLQMLERLMINGVEKKLSNRSSIRCANCQT